MQSGRHTINRNSYRATSTRVQRYRGIDIFLPGHWNGSGFNSECNICIFRFHHSRVLECICSINWRFESIYSFNRLFVPSDTVERLANCERHWANIEHSSNSINEKKNRKTLNTGRLYSGHPKFVLLFISTYHISVTLKLHFSFPLKWNSLWMASYSSWWISSSLPVHKARSQAHTHLLCHSHHMMATCVTRRPVCICYRLATNPIVNKCGQTTH